MCGAHWPARGQGLPIQLPSLIATLHVLKNGTDHISQSWVDKHSLESETASVWVKWAPGGVLPVQGILDFTHLVFWVQSAETRDVQMPTTMLLESEFWAQGRGSA